MKNKFQKLKGLQTAQVVAELVTKKEGIFNNVTIENNDTEHDILYIICEKGNPLVLSYSDVVSFDNEDMQGNIEYFIFGEDACQVLLEGGIDELLSGIKKEDSKISFALYEFDLSSPTPADMLNEFSGWGDYQTLTKENYLTLKNLQ